MVIMCMCYVTGKCVIGLLELLLRMTKLCTMGNVRWNRELVVRQVHGIKKRLDLRETDF